MEIKNQSDLRKAIELIATYDAKYELNSVESSTTISYNHQKGCIELYKYRGNPYTGERSESSTPMTKEEVFDYLKDLPNHWIHIKPIDWSPWGGQKPDWAVVKK